MKCVFCKAELKIEGKVGRREVCPNCGRDLHCCLQCKFHDPHAYNECREVSAERVVDKERANFCEYFIIKGDTRDGVNKVQEAKEALERLFRKK